MSPWVPILLIHIALFSANTGCCDAKDQYIEQFKDTLATSVPKRIAGFIAEPIQVSRANSGKSFIFTAFPNAKMSPAEVPSHWPALFFAVGRVGQAKSALTVFITAFLNFPVHLNFWQGVNGVAQYPKGFLKEAFRLVRERGGVCIADEVSI